MTSNCYIKLSSLSSNKSSYKSNRIYIDLFYSDYPQLCNKFRDLCLERKSKYRLKHMKLAEYQKEEFLRFSGQFVLDDINEPIKDVKLENSSKAGKYYLYCNQLPEFYISLKELPQKIKTEYKIFGRISSNTTDITNLTLNLSKKPTEIEIISTGFEEEGELKKSVHKSHTRKKSRSRDRKRSHSRGNRDKYSNKYDNSNNNKYDKYDKHHSHRHHHHRRKDSNRKSQDGDKRKKNEKILEEKKEEMLLEEKEQEEKLLQLVEKGINQEEQNEEQIIQQRKLQRMMLVAKLQQNTVQEPIIKENEDQKINEENNNIKKDDEEDNNNNNEFEEVELEERKSLKVDQAQLDYFRFVDRLRQKQFDEQLEADTKDLENKKEVTEQLKEEALKQPKKEVFDMFADSPINLDEKNDALKPIIPILSQLEWDDEDHYLKVQIGEILNGQYQVTQKCGKGVFSNVIQAVDRVTQLPCALKILRSDEIFIRAGERERDILKQLNITDKSDKRHIIRMYGSFEYRKHLILVFELMERDLRETLKIYGKKIGLSLEAVRSYAKQMFVALSHMKKQKIIHADIKPDNILTDQKSNKVKLCDFGTAFSTSETILVEELQSRFYRAPEIILGCPYDTAIDIWSMGASLYELYTGNFLFPGSTNNHMLKLMMQTKGKPNNRMIRRGEFSGKYFDPNYQFFSNEIDKVTQEQYIKPIKVSEKPLLEYDLGTLLKLNDPLLNGEQLKELMLFRDLLEKTLMMDPNKRISPEDALRHPFISPPSILTQKK